MSGIEDYNTKYQKRIDNKIKQNSDIECLFYLWYMV